MTLPDFDSYCAVKDSVLNAYEDRMSWANKMVINIAKAGYFSSDRTIAILFRTRILGNSIAERNCPFLFLLFIFVCSLHIISIIPII